MLLLGVVVLFGGITFGDDIVDNGRFLLVVLLLAVELIYCICTYIFNNTHCAINILSKL